MVRLLLFSCAIILSFTLSAQSTFKNFYTDKEQIYLDSIGSWGFYQHKDVFESEDYYISYGERYTYVQGPSIEIIYDTTAPYFLVVDKITGALVTSEQIRNETCEFSIRNYAKSSYGYIGAGYSRSPQDTCETSINPVGYPINSRMYLHGLNDRGELLWQKNFEQDDKHLYGLHIRRFKDGNFVIRANKKDKQTNVFERFFMIVNEDGDSLTSIPVPASTGGAFQFEQFSKGYYLLNGFDRCIEYDENLDSVTSYQFLTQDNDNKPFFLNDETFIVSSNLGIGVPGEKARLIKYNKEFEIEWQHVYEGVNAGQTFAEVSDGNYVVGYKDFAKVTPEGEVLWSHNYFIDDPYGYISGATETSDGGFLISARTRNFNLMLVKTDCEGNLEWSNSSCKRPSENNFDLYPNPSTGEVHAQFFDVGDGKEIKIILSNLTGQEVQQYTRFDETLVNLDISTLSAGVYYYTILVDNQTYANGKLVKQ